MVMKELRRVSNFSSSGGFHPMIQILETDSTGRYLSTSAPALNFKAIGVNICPAKRKYGSLGS